MKICLVNAMVFTVVVLDVKADSEESWALKNWCFWTVVLEKTLERPLDCKEIQPVHPKGDQSWMFIGSTDAEAKTPILWPPDVKSWLIWKYLDTGKDWEQEEKGMTEDEMVGWHHRLNGHEFGWTPEVVYGQRGLACCGSRGLKELDMTEQLNWTELIIKCITLKPISLYFENLLTVIVSITLIQLKWLIHWYLSFTLYCNPLGDSTLVYFFPLCHLLLPNRAFGFFPLDQFMFCSILTLLWTEWIFLPFP